MNAFGLCLLSVVVVLSLVALYVLWRAEPKDEELRP